MASGAWTVAMGTPDLITGLQGMTEAQRQQYFSAPIVGAQARQQWEAYLAGNTGNAWQQAATGIPNAPTGNTGWTPPQNTYVPPQNTVPPEVTPKIPFLPEITTFAAPLVALRAAVVAAHPDWPPVMVDEAMAILVQKGVTAEQYTQYQNQIDQTVLQYTAPVDLTAPDIITNAPYKDETGTLWLQKDTLGNVTVVGPVTTPEKPDAIYGPPTLSPDGKWWIQTDQYGNTDVISQVQNTQYGEIQTDPKTGIRFQIGPNGEYREIGYAPTGPSTSAPTASAGWGQQWGQGDLRYDPTTGTMVRDWTKTPLSQQETLAQMQTANLPQNWYNTALQERTMAPDQRLFNNTVGQTVGEMVGAKQGYAPNFDLQQGQSAMGITPSGWYQDWTQGYGANSAPAGGYETYMPSAQQLGSWNPSQYGQMQGWLDTGMAGYNPEDYWNAANAGRPPSGGGTRLSYR